MISQSKAAHIIVYFYVRKKCYLSHCILDLSHTDNEYKLSFGLQQVEAKSYEEKITDSSSSLCYLNRQCQQKPSSIQTLCEILYVLIQIYKGNKFTLLVNSEFTVISTRILPRYMPHYLDSKRVWAVLHSIDFSKSGPWTNIILIFSNCGISDSTPYLLNLNSYFKKNTR